MDKKGLTVSEFIEQVFLTEYREIVNNPKYKFISFSLILSGIELLGKCLDDDCNFSDGDPKEFFKKGMNAFPHKYKSKKRQFYKDLRCGFAHVAKPIKESSIVLGCRGKSSRKNLSIVTDEFGNTRRVLFIEDFYSEFVKVCRRVQDDIKFDRLRHPKVKDIFLPIRNYK